MSLSDILSSNKTVLGIDASTNSAAYCLMSRTGPVEWGEVTFSGKSVWERLQDARTVIPQQIGHLSPDIIVFESAVFVQNKRTVVLLAYAFGVVVSALVKSTTVVHEIPPITWQLAIGNKALSNDEKSAVQSEYPGKSKSWYTNKYRETRKQRTMDWVKTKFGIDAANDNIGDAIALSHVGYHKFID